jgi:RND family efflux transporter MFP subunit
VNTTNDPLSATPHTHKRGRKKSHAGFLVLVTVVAVVLAAGVAYELSKRKAEQQTLATTTVEAGEASSSGALTVARVRTAQGEASVELPGQTTAAVETPIYARADGFIKQRFVEIGKRVKKGDILVELETPDLDQQIEQARATLAQSRAALAQIQASLRATQSASKLAQLTATRVKTLADQGVMARQDADDKSAAAEVADANEHAAEESVRAQQSVINANEANLRRLQEQKKYARVEAPFDGVVTSRNTQASDEGTLITSGSGTNAREIMRISQVQSLRVYVSVPQSYAPVVKPGTTAVLTVEELPGRTFSAKVEGTTESLDPGSRTLQTLLTVDNSRGTLLPGMFVKVKLRLDHAPSVVRLPAEALLIRSEGPTAAVVDSYGKVHIQRLQLGRDYGTEVEVTSGLTADDRVILNPSDTLRDGMVVTVKERARGKT